jgi:predicted amidohydrolase YtcJ
MKLRFRQAMPALLIAVAASTPAAAAPPADLVVTDARIYTADAHHSMAQALAVREGRIVYVGSEQNVRTFVGPKTQVERLGGRLVLPGLIDAHIHPIGIVDLDICTLRSEAKPLREIVTFVQGCIDRYKIPAGEWVSVRQWNYTNGNEPDADNPTLRAALDRVSTTHPIQLLGNDGHHGAFNSMALARARNAAGQTVGYSKKTLAGDLQKYRHLVGVDLAGEPNGTVNEDARARMGTPSLRLEDISQLMSSPGRITARLNSTGITGIMDASVPPQALPLYDALERSGRLTARITLALFYDPDLMRTATGEPDWDTMVYTAKTVRTRYANDPLIRANFVKLFADGVLEGNPYAVPPTLPEVAGIRPYLQPIFQPGPYGHPRVTGYVDTASPLCTEVRAHTEQYDGAEAAARFLREHGYHPRQCQISLGQLQHERPVILEFVRRFHLAGFNIHIHAIGDMGIRTAVDAIEAARAADGVSTTHDSLAHVQLLNPDDVPRIGRDHLFLAFTYAWADTDPEYDLSVVPFYDRVTGSGYAALHPEDGYYERNAYPVRSLRDAGAVLVAGSDAPVDTSDPRPFINMSMAVTRALPGQPALNASEAISIRDVIDAYTIAGARFLSTDKDAGSLEVGKSGDFIVLDRDILALADAGQAAQAAGTKVLSTYFMGNRVYSSNP